MNAERQSLVYRKQKQKEIERERKKLYENKNTPGQNSHGIERTRTTDWLTVRCVSFYFSFYFIFCVLCFVGMTFRFAVTQNEIDANLQCR